MFLSNGSLITKTPISLTQGSSWWPSIPPMSSPTWPSAYAGIYNRQLWVYVVVNKLAKATARLPLVVYERDELNRPRVDDHPLAELLRNPNPAMSGFDLWLWVSSTWDIYGDTFLLKDRDTAGNVRALWPMHPVSMQYDQDNETWTFDNGRRKIENIKSRNLVTFRSFHPDSHIRGLSPIEPLRATLENEWSARTATSSFWERGARPGLALEHPGQLSEAAQDRLRRDFDAATAGASKTGRTAVLEEGMKATKIDLTAEEAQYIESRKLNREEVCAAYDIPPPVVHILDHATYSNITEQMRSMYRDTMAPRLRAIEAAIELDLRAAEFGGDNVYAEFLMDEVLRGDFESRQDALQKASHMTIAEKRKIENLPFIAGTDRIFLNTATMPLDAIDAQAAAIAAGALEPPQPEPELPESVTRTVMGRLSWQKTLDDVVIDDILQGVSQRDVVEGAFTAEKAANGSVAGLRSRIKDLSAPDVEPPLHVHVTPQITVNTPASGVKSRRVERDEAGEIVRIVEET